MHRVRISWALVLPALWLVLSLGSLSGPVWTAGVEARDQARAAADAPPQELSGHASNADAVASYPARRHRPEPVGTTPAAQAVFKPASLLCPADHGLSPSVEVLSLACTWQFRLRAAPQPRAPSCLS